MQEIGLNKTIFEDCEQGFGNDQSGMDVLFWHWASLPLLDVDILTTATLGGTIFVESL